MAVKAENIDLICGTGQTGIYIWLFRKAKMYYKCVLAFAMTEVV
jgi:hypothetical protein